MWPEIQIAKEENRRQLKLSGSIIRKRFDTDSGQLDETIYELTALNLLDIDDTPLDEISPKIAELKNLQSLLLFRNKINSIPVELGKLSLLKVLDLSNNQIETLPDEINELKLLTTVNFSGNKLRRVDFHQLENLIVCNLAANRLEEFPTLYCGKDVHYLAELNLEKNQIREIPASAAKQAGLKVLNVVDNNIEFAPQLLVKCPKLKEVNLKGNPLKDKRLKKLVEQCHSKQVLDYIEKNGYIIPENNESNSFGNKNATEVELELPIEIDIRPKITIIKPMNEVHEVCIGEEAKDIRPYVLHCLVRNFVITSMKKFLKLQNDLHDTECGRRELATIATHDFVKIKGKIRYQADLSEQIQITPLGAKAKVTAEKYYDDLKQQAEIIRKEKKRNTYSGVHKFINLLEGKVFVFFSDEEKVISLPPLTNCDETKVSPETKDMLLEVTSSVSAECCHKVMLELLKRMLLLDVQVTRSHNEGKKKAKGKKNTVVTYDRSAEIMVEQVRLTGTDGKFHILFPVKGDLRYPDEEKIDVEFK
ncbi:leucine-rich repeat-containing protein 47-like [Malaya genurostris]|uniref:leucine-rich repeat-containing protein 47-like n=1 Tax=Malaya genurostris TaxID=325434 RepID=UPI0026F3CA77|nr:leucine-rich repeat-containing protein 47-like [Malaya genurostris]